MSMTLLSEELTDKLSPMMAQWHACKKSAQDALLLFRLGDFYEAFYEDAALLSKELELTLTKRQEVPMAGIPFIAAEGYIDRLVAKGFRVAIAEQTEKKEKGLVNREVVRVVTPATAINSSLVADKESNFFIALSEVGQTFGLAALDVTTGEFKVAEFSSKEEAFNELYRLRPKEFLSSKKFARKYGDLLKSLQNSLNILINHEEDWRFEHDTAYQCLKEHFKVHSLDGFGIRGMCAAINAAGALLFFIKVNLNLPLDHLQGVSLLSTSSYLSIEPSCERHLDLTDCSGSKEQKSKTLLSTLDQTLTPMGGRLFRYWLRHPLMEVAEITARQDSIEELLIHEELLAFLPTLLANVRDLERLMIKVCSGYASLKDLIALKLSLFPIPQLKESLEPLKSPLLQTLKSELKDVSSIISKIHQALVDDPPLRPGDGSAFRPGFHPPLDELQAIRKNSHEWIAGYQQKLREMTGCKTLKIGYTRAFGYYIEISKGQCDKALETFQRRQTLINAERFVTDELKAFEHKVLSAQEQIAQIEQELFRLLCSEIAAFQQVIFSQAKAIAAIDCLLSLSRVAQEYGYVRPLVDESSILSIKDGRHPVIERFHLAEKFIANDTYLDDQSVRMMLITGPNMAGKSTYIRQVALIVIMAQMGSFIPAAKGHIGIVDKIFTRIGASDNLVQGQSTFMVEMTETAHILNNVSDKSLVILDEIGRGTSTYDGISIAWAVAEYLLKQGGKRAKTLFATHYFELTQMEEQIPGVINFSIAVEDTQGEVLFLRKIIRGSADRSFGIHVAKLAGVPIAVIHLAQQILEQLELKGAQNQPKQRRGKSKKAPFEEVQLTFFEPTQQGPLASSGKNQLGDALIQEIRSIHLNELTPIQALTKLAEWQSSFGGPNKG